MAVSLKCEHRMNELRRSGDNGDVDSQSDEQRLESRTLYLTIRKWQSMFFDHIMRRERLKNIVMTEKIMWN